jgi:hypothetical protein
MKLVILGEGRVDLGRFYTHRDFLQEVDDEHLGAVETLIKRVAKDIYGRDISILGLPKFPPPKPHYSRDASLAEILSSEELISKVLYPCFRPAMRSQLPNAADAAIVTCDTELAAKVTSVLDRVRRNIPGPVVQVTFNPEFEATLFEKDAIEKACGRPHCNIRQLPDDKAIVEAGGVKEALVQCIIKAGYRQSPHPNSSEFKVRVVRAMSVEHIKSSGCGMEELREALGEVFKA